MTTRYETPLKYKDGNGRERQTKVYFELDPVELADWTFENAFEANELRASLMELQAIEKEDSRDLTQDEIRTMLGVIKLLSQISAGRPTDDGEYFLKDPNWIYSYAYRGFRTFLMTNPKEVQRFLTALLDNNVMQEFVKALEETQKTVESEEANKGQANTDNNEETLERYKARVAELEAAQKSNVTQLPTTPSSE